MDTIQGIQMVGTQRSGSNLLRVMLNAIPEIAAPHPPHILQRFVPLLPKYGSLQQPENFKKLVRDVCHLVEINPVPWEGVKLVEEEIFQLCRFPDLYELFRVIYQQAAWQTDSRFWLCKSMKNMFYARSIEATGCRPLYIYLYRDGRDVALSFQKAIVGEKHIYSLAMNWKKDQEEALRLLHSVGSGRFYMLSYESLVSRPEMILKDLCSFLGVSWSESMMDYYKSRESHNTAVAGEMWANVQKPVIKDNTHKFLRSFSHEQLVIFESVAGDVLQLLGYHLYSSPQERIKDFTEEQIKQFSCENNRLKALFLQKVHKRDLELRRPQEELLSRIENY